MLSLSHALTTALPCYSRTITLQGPFTYEALPPEDISFVPLKQTQAFNARDLMQVGGHTRKRRGHRRKRQRLIRV